MAEDPTPDPKPTDSGGRLDPVRLIAENGSADAAVRALAFKLNDVERDNAGYRATINDLKGQVPAEGSRVLTPEQAAQFDALTADLTAAGIETPEKLTAHLDSVKANAAKVAEAERRAEFATVAEVTGAKPDAMPDVFRDGEAFEIRGEGDDRKVYVKPSDDAEPVEFGAYVDANKAALKPALFAEAPAPSPASFPATRTGGPPAPRREKSTEEAAAVLAPAFAI